MAESESPDKEADAELRAEPAPERLPVDVEAVKLLLRAVISAELATAWSYKDCAAAAAEASAAA